MTKVASKPAKPRANSKAAALAKAATAAENNAETRVKQPHGSIQAVMSQPPPTGMPIRPPHKGYR